MHKYILDYIFITGKHCLVEGQVYSAQVPYPKCQPTCSDPMKHCYTTATFAGCVCPEGTVIDDIQNRCVPLSQCSKPSIRFVNFFPIKLLHLYVCSEWSTNILLAKLVAFAFVAPQA